MAGFEPGSTEGRLGEQASLEFDLTFVDVLLHKLVQAYWFNMLKYTLYIIYQSELCFDLKGMHREFQNYFKIFYECLQSWNIKAQSQTIFRIDKI